MTMLDELQARLQRIKEKAYGLCHLCLHVSILPKVGDHVLIEESPSGHVIHFFHPGKTDHYHGLIYGGDCCPSRGTIIQVEPKIMFNTILIELVPDDHAR